MSTDGKNLDTIKQTVLQNDRASLCIDPAQILLSSAEANTIQQVHDLNLHSDEKSIQSVELLSDSNTLSLNQKKDKVLRGGAVDFLTESEYNMFSMSDGRTEKVSIDLGAAKFVAKNKRDNLNKRHLMVPGSSHRNLTDSLQGLDSQELKVPSAKHLNHAVVGQKGLMSSKTKDH